MRSRREFLIGSITGAMAAFGPLARHVSGAGQPVLGMIFPPLNYPVPPEATRLYPSGIKFLSRGVGLDRAVALLTKPGNGKRKTEDLR